MTEFFLKIKYLKFVTKNWYFSFNLYVLLREFLQLHPSNTSELNFFPSIKWLPITPKIQNNPKELQNSPYLFRTSMQHYRMTDTIK